MPFQKITSGKTLSKEEAKSLQTFILKGKLSTDQIIEIFKSLENRELTSEEFLGIIEASREAMTKVETQKPTLDIVGTGGDGLNTFNISTLAAIVCAAAGIPVAKHGNRSASGKCGAFDLLEAVDVKIDLDAKQAEEILEKNNLAFLFARNFHPAFKHVAEARKKYGKQTYFNFLGPLLNPAKAEYQVLGISNKKMIELMGESLIKSGTKKVWIVQSEEGMDEVSPCSKTNVWEYSKDSPDPRKFIINPEEYGMSLCSIFDIVGDCSEVNKKIFMDILENKGSEAQKNAVVLNAAAGIVVYGKAEDMKEGVEIAKKALESEKALQKFGKYQKYSQKFGN